MKRRQFLGGLAGLGVVSSLRVLTGCRSSNSIAHPLENAHESTPRTTTAGTTPRPRHLVLILMRGGFDSVLTTCPKLANEIDQYVDLPYGKDDIVVANGNSFGPHLKPLEQHVAD